MRESKKHELVIEVRGLRNVFGQQVVHDQLDLEVYRGEVLGVIGGSGAGKSVLLRSIVGLKQPNAGQVRLLGEEIAILSPEERKRLDDSLGFVFQ